MQGENPRLQAREETDNPSYKPRTIAGRLPNANPSYYKH